LDAKIVVLPDPVGLREDFKLAKDDGEPFVIAQIEIGV